MATNVRYLTRSAPAKANLKRDLIAAVATGQLAGLIMALTIVMAGKALPPILSGAFLTGLALHQFIALLWSLVFGFLINRVLQTFGNVIAVGLATGVLSQILQGPVIVPALMKVLPGHHTWAQSLPLTWSWVAHLVFGLAFLLFVPIRNRLPAR